MAETAKPILVTGFSSFPGVAENPTEALMARLREEETIDGIELAIHVLPTTYDAVDAFVAETMQAQMFRAYLAFGVASGSAIRLESCGRNRVTATIPDAAGVYRTGCPIRSGGPDSLPGSVPLEPIADALRAAGLPVGHSADAGGYLCNYLYYSALFAARHLPVAFIHVPPLSDAFTIDHLDLTARIAIAQTVGQGV